MKALRQIFTALSLLLFLAACSDDPATTPAGRLENDGDSRVSVLHLAGRDLAGLADLDNVEFMLEDPENRRSLTLGGSMRFDRSLAAIVCRITLGATDIPDGKYFLRVGSDDLPDICTRRVIFSGNIGTEVEAESMSYDDLQGSGTASDPYLINDDGDFLTLLWYLEDDPEHAYGKYFRQTASFDVPQRSMIIDGHVWAPVTFSGSYDGGGYELRSLVYQGSSDLNADNGIGLFKDLYSATITNLSFRNAMIINAGNNVGILAGSCSGTTRFENITLNGTITAAGNNIGALAGASTGSFTIRNITVNTLMVTGNEATGNNVGLLVGSHSGTDFTAENISTPDHIFSVAGAQCVGGIVGSVETDNTLSFSNITIEHSVDAESELTKVVYGASNYTGALAGYTEKNGTINIRAVSVKAPVRGGSDVGALIGHARVADMTVAGATLTSVVGGVNSVGGFFGYLGFVEEGGSVTFDCSGAPIRYIVKSSAAADVTGEKHVGAMAGYFDSNHGTMNFNGRVEIAVNVKGSEEVGGAFGYASRLDNFNPADINFSSPTMRVEASVNYAGGVVGRLNSGTIAGDLVIAPVTELPATDGIPSHFSGVVSSAGTAGGIAGYASGTISGVASSATVTSTGVDAGGIVGRFANTISSCAFTGSVSAAQSAGGIFGISIDGDVLVSDCANYGDVTASSHAGGIGGYTRIPNYKDLLITRCYNAGHITSSAAAGIICYVGSEHSGIRNKYYDVTYCGNGGTITGTGGSDSSVGGIVSTMNNFMAVISLCTNNGPVSGGKQYAIGGIVGDFGRRSDQNFGRITRCANTATVTATSSSTHVGGVAGHLHSSDLTYDSELTDCLNTGDIPCDQSDDTGGILGYAANYTNTYRTFNSGKVSHGNAIIGTHHSGSLFHHSNNYYLSGTGGSWPSSTSVSSGKIADKSVYKGFDFTKIWDITPAGPTLRDCPFL